MKLYLKILPAVFILLLTHSSLSMAQMPDYSSEDQGIDPALMMEGGMAHHPGFWGLHETGMNRWMKPHNAAVHFLHMKEALALNEKQVSELKVLRDTYRSETTINEAKLRMAKEELREILEEDAINVEKAEAKIKEIGALRESIWTSFVKQMAKIKAIVPKEQMKKLHERYPMHPMGERER